MTWRPVNTFAPRQRAPAVIPAIVQLLAGKPVKLGDTRPTSDFVFVDDTASAFLRTGITPGIEGEIIHTGGGREVRIGDLPAMITTAAGLPIEVVDDEYAA